MIVVFGSINLDLVAVLPTLPRPGQTLLATAARTGPGGKGANQAVAARRDGATVVMAGAVGRDALAEAACAGLAAAGVDLARVLQCDATTGFAAIAIDAAGQNQIVVAPGANRLAMAAQVEDAILTPAATLLVQMETDPAQTTALVRRAHARGTRVVLNLAPVRPLDRGVFACVDLLVVNEDEAGFIAGMLGCATEAPALCRALGRTVVRTLGGRGAEAAAPGLHVVQPAPPVRVIDSVGAGDSFTGVLAAALDRGMALPDALRRATLAASLCCTLPGSQHPDCNAAATDRALAAGIARAGME